MRVTVEEKIETITGIQARARRIRLLLAHIFLENPTTLMLNIWHQNDASYSFAMSPVSYTLGKFGSRVIQGYPIIPVHDNFRYLTWSNPVEKSDIINYLGYDQYDDNGCCNHFWDNFLNVIPLKFWPKKIEFYTKGQKEDKSINWRPGLLEQYENDRCHLFEWNTWQKEIEPLYRSEECPDDLKKKVVEADRIVINRGNTHYVWKDRLDPSQISEIFR